MATPATLERLDALVKRLTPLSNAGRGELIRAAHWNTVVSAIVELARAVLAESPADAVPPHNHLDEVSMAWLEKRLRTLINGGALQDPIQTGKLLAAERHLKRLTGDITDRRNDIDRVRSEMDRITTRELTRENQLQSLDRQVSGLRDAGLEVGDLRKTLDGVREQIATVQTIADQFQDSDGNIIDIADLQSRMADLETMREQLTDANGEPLTAISIDHRIAEALNTLVTEDELQSTLEERLGNLDDQIVETVSTQVTNTLDERLEERLDEFRTQIAQDNNRLFAGLDETISQTVAEQMDAISESIQATLKNQMDTRLDELQNTLMDEIGRSANDLSEKFTAADSQLGSTLMEQMTQNLDKAVSEQQASVDNALTKLREDLQRQIQNTNTELSAAVNREVNSTIDRRIASGDILSPNDSAPLMNEVVSSINTRIDESLRKFGLTEEMIGLDDFTALNGIGITFHSRLQAANIRSYADLARLSVEKIAQITGMSVDRVRQLDIAGQARRLSETDPS